MPQPSNRRERFRVSDGFISPVDLVAIGLLSAEEAKEHHLVEAAAIPH